MFIKRIFFPRIDFSLSSSSYSLFFMFTIFSLANIIVNTSTSMWLLMKSRQTVEAKEIQYILRNNNNIKLSRKRKYFISSLLKHKCWFSIMKCSSFTRIKLRLCTSEWVEKKFSFLLLLRLQMEAVGWRKRKRVHSCL